MITVEFTQAEAEAVRDVVRAWTAGVSCPGPHDRQALRGAAGKLAMAIGRPRGPAADHTHDYWFEGDRAVCVICHHRPDSGIA